MDDDDSDAGDRLETIPEEGP
jgi:CheY-like chemotaxis protein